LEVLVGEEIVHAPLEPCVLARRWATLGAGDENLGPIRGREEYEGGECVKCHHALGRLEEDYGEPFGGDAQVVRGWRNASLIQVDADVDVDGVYGGGCPKACANGPR
jgi:hypothetical protein